jgi:hypothetical protein
MYRGVVLVGFDNDAVMDRDLQKRPCYVFILYTFDERATTTCS